MPQSQRFLAGVVRPMLVLLALGGCAPIIADYSVEAYKSATSLKAEVGALIDKSGEKFSLHQKEVDATTTRINAAYEFAAGLANNSISAQQWQILRNPDGNLYGGFVRLWRKQGTTSAAYRSGKSREIAAAFDLIICLESNKKEGRPCASAASEEEPK
jgi:hypothetical protein